MVYVVLLGPTPFHSFHHFTHFTIHISKKFGVRGVPALFFLKSDSEKISGVPGYIEPEVFLKMLEFIHTESYKKIQFSEYSKTI